MGPGFTASELCEHAGVSAAMLKYYLREELLQPPHLDRPGRRYYDQRHLERLTLLRALRDVGRLHIETTRALVARLDHPSTVFELVATVVDALSPEPAGSGAEFAQARRDVDTFLKHRNIETRPDSRARDDLAGALLSLRRLLVPALPAETFTPYLDALRELAAVEVATNAGRMKDSSAEAMGFAVLGTLLWEPVLLSLRRLLHEHFARTAIFKKPATASKTVRRRSPSTHRK